MPDTSKARRLTQDEASELLRLRTAGWSYKRIAAHLQISWSSVRDRLRRLALTGNATVDASHLLHRAAGHARGGRHVQAVLAAESALALLAELDSESRATHSALVTPVLP